MPSIDCWSIVGRIPDPNRTDVYGAPEALRARPSLSGLVKGHPAFADGERITTSQIVSITAKGRVQTLSGSVYELGAPDAIYEVMFPDALDRLKAALSA